MSLPFILKYIYNNSPEESIRRGKRIFNTAGVYLVSHDNLTEHVEFKVKNDLYANHYKVVVNNFMQIDKISTRCQCPYNMGSVCRHEAAALFQLNDFLQTGFFENIRMEYDQKHTVVRMKQITRHFLKLFSSEDIFKAGNELEESNKVTIIEAKDETVKADVKNKKKLTVIISQNEERYFDTQCGCAEKKHPMCEHKVAVFMHVLNKYGSNYFSTLRNWDTQKNKLLALYGYSLNDDLTGKFEFSYHEGKPFLRVLNPSIKKIAFQEQQKKATTPEIQIDKMMNKHAGIVITESSNLFPHIDFELIMGETDADKKDFKNSVEKTELQQYISPHYLSDKEKNLISALRKMDTDELIKSIKRNSPFGDLLDNLKEQLIQPDENLKQQTWEFYISKYQRLLAQYTDYPLTYWLPKNKKFSADNLKKVSFSPEQFHIQLHVFPKTKKQYCIRLNYKIGTEELQTPEVHRLHAGLLMHNLQIYSIAQLDYVAIVEEFGLDGTVTVNSQEWEKYLENNLLPMSKKVAVKFDESLVKNVGETEPELRVHLKETENSFVFKPAFVYGQEEKSWLDYSNTITAKNGTIYVLERNEIAEQSFLTFLRHFHPAMQESRRSASFILPAKEALKGNWYFEFMDKLKDMKVEVMGYEHLKELKINPNKPRTNIQIVSGIDWFDATMEVAFGEEKVSLNTIKKAFNQKKKFVQLKDGSLGLLPDEWSEKYGLMVKLGKINGDDQIQIKHFHFSTVEHLLEESGNDSKLRELAEKKERLMNYSFEKEEKVELPDNLNAEMRMYQKSGFRWMNFLKNTGWGGILADDMGLGKTLQTLSILQDYINQDNKALFLVVCPTTLMYNWQNEIEKFTTGIKYCMHHGSKRNQDIANFLEHNLIITTYGTLRSDIKILSQLQFDYVVLDESQAIKNPLSQAAKSAMLLKSKNRLALSGTPVQNNTFDLYAQMNFLNPGMLGSMEFFRNEFANPIDKMQEEDSKMHLKKLIAPFLLRRTKEQVAPDLPAKTETVLYCEMGNKQRKVYDSYRNAFRSQILGEIEAKGIDSSRMSILTGLMKLRQICDSPAILNENEKYENNSVKIDELIRELSENMGKHKALVFSQFLGMLSLIKQELERLNIPYVYFDGSTSSTDREAAIQEFQNNKECRVFLISLKAGGVGLNLTAADYVYIVDPWWNPAVEQQAIDRTHRIGQTKNIFAYRLICKDTIEEKIQQLQQRKINLANDLISDENAFLKKLTKEDIAYLLE